MLPRKPKISYGYLKSGIEEFHRKYVLVPADKAANNVVVVWRLQYIDTLKQELSGTKAYEQTSEKEKFVINNHIFHNATRFAVSVNEDQERLPTFYLLPKLHKKPYKARFIANSSSCTTTELSKLLTSCLTTIKNHVITTLPHNLIKDNWLVGWLVVLGLTALWDSISVYIGPSPRDRERKEKIDERKNVQTTPTRTYC